MNELLDQIHDGAFHAGLGQHVLRRVPVLPSSRLKQSRRVVELLADAAGAGGSGLAGCCWTCSVILTVITGIGRLCAVVLWKESVGVDRGRREHSPRGRPAGGSVHNNRSPDRRRLGLAFGRHALRFAAQQLLRRLLAGPDVQHKVTFVVLLPADAVVGRAIATVTGAAARRAALKSVFIRIGFLR